MTNNPSPKFHHGGASTDDLLDPKRVLSAIGLKKGETFLDAGCGRGYLSIAASEIVGSEGRVFAVDIEEPSINVLKEESERRGISNLTAIVGDVTDRTPIDANSIDFCYMGSVLHGFVENRETDGAMKEINRVLKSGGTLAVVEFKKLQNIPGPPFPVKLSPEQTAVVITPYGYREKDVTEVGTYHYAVIFSKDGSKK